MRPGRWPRPENFRHRLIRHLHLHRYYLHRCHRLRLPPLDAGFKAKVSLKQRSVEFRLRRRGPVALSTSKSSLSQRTTDVRAAPSAAPTEPFLPERLRREPTDPINPRTGRTPTAVWNLGPCAALAGKR
jgi:hypothetical protein